MFLQRKYYGLCLGVAPKPQAVIGGGFSEVTGSRVCDMGLIHDAMQGARALELRV